MTTRHLLITGAGGFLGRHTASYFTRQGWRVSGIGHATSDFLPETWGLRHWVQADVQGESLTRLIKETGVPHAVFHCAGTGSVGKSWEDPKKDFERTVTTVALMIETLRRQAPEALLIYPSSAAVYGEAEEETFSEESALHPLSPYGMHKLTAETLCLSAAKAYGLQVSVLRFFSLYGPGLRKQLLWDLVQKFASCGGRLTLSGTGKELRDFMYIEDAARLVEMVTNTPDSMPPILNGATGVATSVADIAHLLADMLGMPVEIAFNGQVRPGNPSHLVGDTTKLEHIGFSPHTALPEGLRQFIAALPEPLSIARSHAFS